MLKAFYGSLPLGLPLGLPLEHGSMPLGARVCHWALGRSAGWGNPQEAPQRAQERLFVRIAAAAAYSAAQWHIQRFGCRFAAPVARSEPQLHTNECLLAISHWTPRRVPKRILLWFSALLAHSASQWHTQCGISGAPAANAAMTAENCARGAP